jgi:septal ring factor EnvC (AmiA/AmiB activator)
MAKKFKINDGGSKYVETATLLEPANNSAANQNEMDEIREVSFQLAQIKKKHDEAKKMGNQKQEELEKIKKEIDQLYVQEVQAEGPTQEMKSKLEMLEESIAETEYKTKEELFTKHSYLHMLERMKKDFIAAKIQSAEHEASLKNKATILDLEQQK